ncbi:unnamed protein product [Pleuronectes platessa]|uniref:Uncharacterized protein n=1 Tax=Pleuronectes platessa TaxID=8262 RepID=A0A9N7UGM6_PLEPL|nr:unnamed protein product [Pleuronectes platessa]
MTLSFIRGSVGLRAVSPLKRGLKTTHIYLPDECTIPTNRKYTLSGIQPMAAAAMVTTSASNPASCRHAAELDISTGYRQRKAGTGPGSVLDKQTDRQKDGRQETVIKAVSHYGVMVEVVVQIALRSVAPPPPRALAQRDTVKAERVLVEQPLSDRLLLNYGNSENQSFYGLSCSEISAAASSSEQKLQLGQRWLEIMAECIVGDDTEYGPAQVATQSQS